MTSPDESALFAELTSVMDDVTPDVAESEAIELAWTLLTHRIRLESTWHRVQTDPEYAALMRAEGDAIYARWAALATMHIPGSDR